MLIPSVTQVIGFVNSRAFDNISPERLEIAQDRGIEFHRLAALYAQNLWIDEIPENCQGYFDSFRRWFDDFVVEVVAVEKTLLHPIFYYTGTPDIIARLKGDTDLTLPDYKTPVAFSKSWRLQLSGYREDAVANGYPVRRVASLQPHPKGKRAKFKEYTKSLTPDFAVFLSALNVWRFFNA